MADDASKTCWDCEGTMHPIVIMDRDYNKLTGSRMHEGLEYRQPDDRRSFWTGKYPTAGKVQAFMCENCGRIELYGSAPNT
jgi:hypothetical protein